MDVVQKVTDLMRLALDERTDKNEAANAAFGALKLIAEFKLLQTSKRVDVAASIIEKFTSPLFVGEIANRVEGIVDSVDRALGALSKLKGKLDRGEDAPRGRRRKYNKRTT